jgi:hypothetical protein
LYAAEDAGYALKGFAGVSDNQVLMEEVWEGEMDGTWQPQLLFPTAIHKSIRNVERKYGRVQ